MILSACDYLCVQRVHVVILHFFNCIICDPFGIKHIEHAALSMLCYFEGIQNCHEYIVNDQYSHYDACY